MASLPTLSVLGCCIAAVAIASPAGAQTIFYEDGDYLYAVPSPGAVTPEDDVVTYPVNAPEPVATVAQRIIPARSSPPSQPVGTIVLPELGQAPISLPVILPRGYAPYPGAPTQTVAYPANRVAPPVSPVYAYDYANGVYASGPAVPSAYLPNGALLVEFDRAAWLEECRNRLVVYDEHDRGRVIGGLGGAIVGGVIGNRIVDGNRLGGTLVGAGLGGFAGSTVGDSIDDRAERRSGSGADAHCTAYLDDYLARASNWGVQTVYRPGEQYMLVPVTVPVAQQRIYREDIAATD